MDEFPGRGSANLKPCRHCGRTFMPESLAKHEPSCKNIQKKRKPFDPAKQRVTEDLSLKQIKAAQKKTVPKPKTHWKEQHQQFVSNIRAARGAQACIDRGDPLPPPPPPTINSDYVQCPHCDRRFNEKAAERHISFCASTQKRLPAKRQPSEQEKARAAAKGYQAPRPGAKARGPAGETSPAMGGGGYGASRGGYSSGAAAAPRGRTPPGPTGSRSEMGRAPGGSGYGGNSTGGYSSGGMGAGPQGTSAGSSRGRAPVRGAPRGRAVPASQGRHYADSDLCLPDYGGLGDNTGTGPALRTGRDLNTYEEARRDAKGSQSTPTVTKKREDMLSRRPISGSKSKSAHNMMGGMDSGYYSGNSESDINNYSKNSMSVAGVSKYSRSKNNSPGGAVFCHECGTKYPVTMAKFCMECGMKKISI